MSEQEFGVKMDLAVGQARMLGMFEDWDDLADMDGGAESGA